VDGHSTASAQQQPHGPWPAARWRGLRITARLLGVGAAGTAGYILGGPALALVAVLAVAVVATVIAIALAAMLGRSDPRSPFVRLMLVICVLKNRPPADYLPEAAPDSPPLPEVGSRDCPGG
jgi:hypothetical protein